MLDGCDDDQRSTSSTRKSFSTASLADEAEVAARNSENSTSKKSPKHQHQQRNQTRGKELRGIRNNSGIGDSNRSVAVARGRQLPLAEMISRKAFECVIGTNGELSRIIDVDDNETTAAVVKSNRDHCTKPTSASALKNEAEKKADGNRRKTSSCEGSPTSGYRLEPLPYGAGISISSQVSLWCGRRSVAMLS